MFIVPGVVFGLFPAGAVCFVPNAVFHFVQGALLHSSGFRSLGFGSYGFRGLKFGQNTGKLNLAKVGQNIKTLRTSPQLAKVGQRAGSVWPKSVWPKSAMTAKARPAAHAKIPAHWSRQASSTRVRKMEGSGLRFPRLANNPDCIELQATSAGANSRREGKAEPAQQKDMKEVWGGI